MDRQIKRHHRARLEMEPLLGVGLPPLYIEILLDLLEGEQAIVVDRYGEILLECLAEFLHHAQEQAAFMLAIEAYREKISSDEDGGAVN